MLSTSLKNSPYAFLIKGHDAKKKSGENPVISFQNLLLGIDGPSYKKYF